MQLLGGRRRGDGTPILQGEELRDGIIAFEDAGDAERYGALVQAESNAEVTCPTQVSSGTYGQPVGTCRH